MSNDIRMTENPVDLTDEQVEKAAGSGKRVTYAPAVRVKHLDMTARQTPGGLFA